MTLKDLTIQNKGWEFLPLPADPAELAALPEAIRIRGYQLARHEERVRCCCPRLQLGAAPACACCWPELLPLLEVSDHASQAATWGGTSSVRVLFGWSCCR